MLDAAELLSYLLQIYRLTSYEFSTFIRQRAVQVTISRAVPTYQRGYRANFHHKIGFGIQFLASVKKTFSRLLLPLDTSSTRLYHGVHSRVSRGRKDRGEAGYGQSSQTLRSTYCHQELRTAAARRVSL
jgi:hypothetical protein